MLIEKIKKLRKKFPALLAGVSQRLNPKYAENIQVTSNPYAKPFDQRIPFTPMWAQPPRTDLPNFKTFTNISILPERGQGRRYVENGGPVWPDFAHEKIARHFIAGNPVDTAPLPYDGPITRINESFTWGGFAGHHFGHLAGEHLTRVLISVRQRPMDKMMFALPWRPKPNQKSGSFLAITKWFGVDESTMFFVDKPIVVSELHVMPQAEQLRYLPPSPAYLDLLAENMLRNRLVPKPSKVLFVTREGLVAKNKGGPAGEAYLAQRLRALGVTVFDPAKVPLVEQLELYAGAETIIFTEGSAMHGRQLLGYFDQSIKVIVRRPGFRFCEGAMSARSSNLQYWDVIKGIITPNNDRGVQTSSMALGLFDVPLLFDAFRSLGVDLSSGWNERDYMEDMQNDVRAWVKFYRSRIPEQDLPAARALLSAVGCEKLLSTESQGI